ncbi:unnamed protein product [Brachionus calyciflorus]|uniref:Uncharacterized protein n=1 Tax=Brachionus calyciflorus TaxID=104777 RepID=A0A814DFR7_9BILA|nr:unnamed protein product [Brachionus calyciflorus]
MIAMKEDIKLIPSETIQNIKFIHANELIDNFDLLNEFEKFRQGNIEQENLIIDDYKQIEEIPINFQMNNYVSSLSESLRKTKNYMIGIMISLIIIVLTYLGIKFKVLNKVKNFRSTKKRKDKKIIMKYEPQKEMEEIRVEERNEERNEEIIDNELDIKTLSNIIDSERKNLVKYHMELKEY